MILTILKLIWNYGKYPIALFEELLPNISGWPAILFAVCFSIYWCGHNSGVNSCQAKQVQIEQNMSKKHDEIETNTNKLTTSQLDKRLHKFQRD